MLKEIVASKAAKLIAACVCPVVGTAALTVSVPEVRERVHRATAPRAEAAPAARQRRAPAQAVAAAEAVCPTDTPIILASSPIAPYFAGPVASPPLAFAPPGGPGGGGGFFFGGAPGIPIGGFIPGPGVEPPPPPPVIPEPGTWIQMIVGFGVIGGATRLTYRQQRPAKVDPEA